MTVALLVAGVIVSAAAQAAKPKVEVMIVGTYHFANPKADLIKTELDDHMSAKRQKEIEEVVDLLAKYKPTKVMVERPPEDGANDRYHDYLAGAYTLTVNEVDQIGMRLSHQCGLKDIYPIDFRAGLDFDPSFAFAKKNDSAFMDYVNSTMAYVQKQLTELQDHTVRENLVMQNRPDTLHLALEVYVKMLRLNDGKDYPGADLLTAWYSRNLRIFGNLETIVQPGDRVLVIFGQGHAPILRQMVEADSDMKLVEPNKYLNG